MSTVSTHAQPVRPSNDRVLRTMDVTRSLLLRSGYKRTTMDEIARRADVGKGTIYLSWDTKDELIRTLVIHEIIGVCEGLTPIIQLRPAAARLSECARELFTLLFGYPLFRALYTYDKEVIGKVCDDPLLEFQAFQLTSFEPFREYLDMLARHDLWNPANKFALDALMSGFVKLHLHAEIAGPTTRLDVRATNLAQVIKASMESGACPSDEPAQQTIKIFTAAADRYRAKLTPSASGRLPMRSQS